MTKETYKKAVDALLDVMAEMVEEPVQVEQDHKRLKEVYERVSV